MNQGAEDCYTQVLGIQLGQESEKWQFGSMFCSKKKEEEEENMSEGGKAHVPHTWLVKIKISPISERGSSVIFITAL